MDERTTASGPGTAEGAGAGGPGGTAAGGPRLDLRSGTQRTFAHVLVNALLVSVVNYTLWFAVTFWVYLQTRSVFATGMIAGIFLVATATTGIWFGSIVDHHHKQRVLQASAATSLAIYLVCLAGYLLTPAEAFRDPASLRLWAFVVLLMLGVIAGNLRTIALPTLVTLLVPDGLRDRANGLVGTTSGVSFLVTSVISGLLVAAGGMRYALLLAVAVLAGSLVHLARVHIPERRVVTTAAAQGEPSGGAADPGGVDVRGTLRLIRGVPGLMALIAFSCFNNFLGGTFMALMDAYGLSLVSVEVWGLLWGALSAAMILGGLAVARFGLGATPVRTLLLVNVALWLGTAVFPLRSSIVLLAVGMTVFLFLMPFAEASEQTVLQRVVPYERQGRVFGFAQSVEQAASPLTAFLISPVTQFVVIPFMTDGAGARAIGGWFGTGPDRGLALVFVVTALIGLLVTLLALVSRPYRRLSAAYRTSLAPAGADHGPAAEATVGAPALGST
ncbi:MFS transporter [Geodermatophilus sp. DSM 45219]|uniref:MFS transporter n=1 Tax=Geodermatophilus sp. DSM 45219 TaxID=1881103 RepID=UPI00088B85E5|nr:MFS transporter [Geodermatophilus sp. DSM 45219]SDN47069.1 MFS transporter, DHA3 family, multidrug efflux protein [Geodermatophilus sp. DSM 45219]